MKAGFSAALVAGLLAFACSDDDGGGGGGDTDTDADTDSDSDTDSDVDECAELGQALQEALDEHADHPNAPGAIVGVDMYPLSDECGIFATATGLAHLEPEESMSTGHLFLLGSITKTYTAAVTLLLVEQGELALTDTLDQWNDTIPNAAQITIEQLLNHTSGIFNYVDDPEFFEFATSNLDHVWTPDEILSYILDEEPYFAPGEGWHYTNSGYILLGTIIEQVTGQTVGQAYYDLLLDPLNLPSTFFYCEDDAGEAMCGHYMMGEDMVGVMDPSWSWTAGAMGSDVFDQLAWCRALFGGDVLGGELQAQMLDFEPTPYPGWAWGLGPSARTDSTAGELWGHDGRGPGVQSELWYAPDLDACISVFVNVTPDEAPDVSADILLEGVLPLLAGLD